MSSKVIVGLMGMRAEAEAGQDLLEYGLLTSLIATFVIGSLTLAGKQINDLWLHISKGF